MPWLISKEDNVIIVCDDTIYSLFKAVLFNWINSSLNANFSNALNINYVTTNRIDVAYQFQNTNREYC